MEIKERWQEGQIKKGSIGIGGEIRIWSNSNRICASDLLCGTWVFVCEGACLCSWLCICLVLSVCMWGGGCRCVCVCVCVCVCFILIMWNMCGHVYTYKYVSMYACSSACISVSMCVSVYCIYLSVWAYQIQKLAFPPPLLSSFLLLFFFSFIFQT